MRINCGNESELFCSRNQSVLSACGDLLVDLLVDQLVASECSASECSDIDSRVRSLKGTLSQIERTLGSLDASLGSSGRKSGPQSSDSYRHRGYSTLTDLARLLYRILHLRAAPPHTKPTPHTL